MMYRDNFETMRNLGPVSAGWLRQAGIDTVAELKRVGPVAAFQMVKQRQPMASLNLLWAFAATLAGKDMRDLTAGERLKLHGELRRLSREAVQKVRTAGMPETEAREDRPRPGPRKRDLRVAQ